MAKKPKYDLSDMNIGDVRTFEVDPKERIVPAKIRNRISVYISKLHKQFPERRYKSKLEDMTITVKRTH